MPHCDEWGLAAIPVALEFATMAQRCHLIARLLVDQEAIEEDEGSDALVRCPRRHLRSSHLASPRASAPGASGSAGASTSHATLMGSLFHGATGGGDLEWCCLLDSPR
jgi:hypothetical protein